MVKTKNLIHLQINRHGRYKRELQISTYKRDSSRVYNIRLVVRTASRSVYSIA